MGRTYAFARTQFAEMFTPTQQRCRAAMCIRDVQNNCHVWSLGDTFYGKAENEHVEWQLLVNKVADLNLADGTIIVLYINWSPCQGCLTHIEELVMGRDESWIGFGKHKQLKVYYKNLYSREHLGRFTSAQAYDSDDQARRDYKSACESAGVTYMPTKKGWRPPGSLGQMFREKPVLTIAEWNSEKDADTAGLTAHPFNTIYPLA